MSRSTERFGAEADEAAFLRRGRETGQERFDAMSRAEQDAALGPETAEAVRSGKIRLRDLKGRDDMGRTEQRDLEDAT